MHVNQLTNDGEYGTNTSTPAAAPAMLSTSNSLWRKLRMFNIYTLGSRYWSELVIREN
jgi:hypothetical protein